MQVDKLHDSLPLFSGKSLNVKLSSRQASNLFIKWKKKSGIRKNLTIHSFRAGYATLLYKKTKDPLLVSYALGHSSFNTTKWYINENLFNLHSVVDTIFDIPFCK